VREPPGGIHCIATAVVAAWARYLLPGSAELPLRLIYHSAALLLVGFATS